MELFQAKDHYILQSGERALWCSRRDGSLQLRAATDLLLAWNPICLGLVEGVIGKVQLHTDLPWWLLLIRQKALIGKLPGDHEVCKITKIAVIPLSETEPQDLELELCKKHHFGINKPEKITQSPDDTKFLLKTLTQIKSNVSAPNKKKIKESKEKEKLEKRLLEELFKMFMDSDSFYYSLTYDLTNSVQRQSVCEKTKLPLWQKVDDRFFWNKHMIEDLITLDNAEVDFWIIPIIQGFVQIEELVVNYSESSDDDKSSPETPPQESTCVDDVHPTFLVALISRRSRHRAGMRYKRRGVDKNGNVANYVETEQLIHVHNHTLSFIQTRGSVPVFWSQVGYRYNPRPRLDKSENETVSCFRAHFEEQLKNYKKQVIINLVDQTGREKIIGDAYLKQVLLYNNANLTYVSFDFHEHCRGMKFENVQTLTDAIHDIILDMKWCWVDQAGVICKQEGIFRVNCMDCLDRTNVVQAAIARVVMEQQLKKLGVMPPEQPLPVKCNRIYQIMWANNGDAISRQYAGTAALKGDFTRTGERKLAGVMKDGVNSANRYYLNRFRDAYRQAVIDAGSSVEEMEFSWDEYLEDTGAIAAPHGSFKHVDTSLQNGFAPGMKLEVAVKSDQNTYWVATIITTCGQLLLLRYDGYGEDRKADFWCDIMTADLHPIGWCEQNKKILKVPEGIKDKIPDQEEFLQRVLKGACSAPANLLEGLHRGKNPLDLIAPGSRLELQNVRDSLEAWIVNVVENVGGRLKLRYEGLEDSDKFDQWLFYLDPFLHQVGWAAQHGYSLQPPLAIKSLKSEADWQEILKKVKEEEEESSIPTDLFKDKPVIGVHSFSEGMKLEAVDPMAPFVISPATVLKVYNEKYFMIEIDDLRPDRTTSQSYICHVNSAGIFPVQWSLKNGLHLIPPPGYPGQDFDWADYLKQCGAEAAPQSCFPSLTSDHGFKENMKLEAVNPVDPEEVCIATVTKLKDSYLWLQLEGSKKPVPDCIVSVESMNIFPVGWCETNGYQLRPPRKAIVNKQKKIAVVQPEKQILSSRTVHDGLKNQEMNSSDSVVINGKYCCPKIYFNHRCFSGPYLNKGRIAELPQSVGPGNCVLVLKEVLTLLINAAYKPSRVLRELQLDEKAAWHGHGETLKAKYKGKSYRATVEVVRTADRVADFCRKTCIKLECCPNLFGPQMVLDKCSENCSVLTKTKYTHYYGKRKNKRIGRPPGGHSNLEVAMKKPNKRRKRRKHFFVHKKKRSSASVDNTPAGSPQGSGGEEEDDQDEVDEESLTEDSTSEHQDELLEESEVSEKKSLSSSPTQSELSHSLAQDRDKRKRKLRTFSFSDDENKPPLPKDIKVEVAEKLQLDSNPLEWSVADVVRFLKSTDCAPLARIFLDQEIDGQALLLLTLPTVQECMDLKLGPAIKLCHHIERVKLAFYQQFAN